MKKFLTILFLFLGLSICQAQVTTSVNAGTLTTTGTGTPITVINNGVDTHNLFFVPVGTPGTITIVIQGSVIGDFTDAATCATSSVTSPTKVTCSGIYSKIRINVTALTGFTSVNYAYVGTSSAANRFNPKVFTETVTLGTGTGAKGVLTLLPSTLVSGTYIVGSKIAENSAGATGCSPFGVVEDWLSYTDLDTNQTWDLVSTTSTFKQAFFIRGGSVANSITVTAAPGTSNGGVSGTYVYRFKTGTAVQAAVGVTTDAAGCSAFPKIALTFTIAGPLD